MKGISRNLRCCKRLEIDLGDNLRQPMSSVTWYISMQVSDAVHVNVLYNMVDEVLVLIKLILIMILLESVIIITIIDIIVCYPSSHIL